jgi:DNA-binding NtrC family response regulator
MGKRSANMFIKLDAGTLAEGELERKLYMGDGGTVYIENIERLEEAEQILLLNVLKNKIIKDLNTDKSTNTNIRLIAGSYINYNTLSTDYQSNSNFIQLFKKSTVNVPCLNEREEDIIPLATIFLNKYCRKYSKNITGFSELAKEILTSTKWVGNTSELSLTIERAVILTPDGGTIQPGYIMLNTESGDISKNSLNTLTLEQMEKKMMRAALKRNNGNITMAAEQLGITRQTLYNKGKKYKLFK